jgi:hypothetical protein
VPPSTSVVTGIDCVLFNAQGSREFKCVKRCGDIFRWNFCGENVGSSYHPRVMVCRHLFVDDIETERLLKILLQDDSASLIALNSRVFGDNREAGLNSWYTKTLN